MSELLTADQVRMVFHARARLFKSVKVRALDGVSIALKQGETLALVGESGSGKTTLARVCLRLLRPTAGRVVFDGTDITKAGERALKEFRRQAQGIFQDPYSSLDPYMDVRQIVEEPLVIHNLPIDRKRYERVLWALGEVKLQPPERIAHSYPHTLSGGQRQRIAIARALVLQPRLVVADEPVSMIDASSRAEVLYLLAELQERHGISFLYITHDLATARHFSHRTAVMYLGRIVETGHTREIIEEPLHPYTKALLAAVPEPDPANRLRIRPVVPGEPPSPVSIPSGCRFHPRCPAFMPGRCNVIDPQLREVRPGHHVACLLYE